MGRWADMRKARKHHLPVVPMDTLVYVGTNMHTSYTIAFLRGFLCDGVPAINVANGTASNLISTLKSPFLAGYHAHMMGNDTQGRGYVYLIWCQLGMDFEKMLINNGANRGVVNREIAMISVEGSHICAVRKYKKRSN